MRGEGDGRLRVVEIDGERCPKESSSREPRISRAQDETPLRRFKTAASLKLSNCTSDELQLGRTADLKMMDSY